MKQTNRFTKAVLMLGRDLPRYTKLIASALTKRLLVYLALAGNSVLLFASVSFYFSEVGQNSAVKNFGDALWWAFTTVSTVGYGDIVPQTALGRITGVILIVVGVFFFLTFMAILGSIVLTITSREIFESEQTTMREYHHLLNEIKKVSAEVGELRARLEKVDKLSQ